MFQDGPHAQRTQASFVGRWPVVLGEPSVDLTGDTQSESTDSETCGPDSAVEESSEGDGDSQEDESDDEMTEVDSQYENESGEDDE